MNNIIFIYKNRLRSILSKYLLYFSMPFLLMGMMRPGEENIYPQIYRHYKRSYDRINRRSIGELNNYNEQLSDTLRSILDGSNQVNLWAQHHASLAKSDLNRAVAIYNRILRIRNLIRTMVSPEELRNRENIHNQDQRLVHGLNENERNMLISYDESERILGLAEVIIYDIRQYNDKIIKNTGGIRGPARSGSIRALRVEENITNDINLNINYVTRHITAYNRSITNSIEHFTKQNSLACKVKNNTVNLHNQVIEIYRLIPQIREQYNNIDLLMPENHQFILVEDNIDYDNIDASDSGSSSSSDSSGDDE